MPTIPEDKGEIRVVVTADELLPVINSSFEKLTELQWGMIKNGAWDSDVQAVLVDMISEIIQIASASIIKRAFPHIQSRIVRGESPEEITSAAGKIKPSLGDSISAAISSALKVLKETCESAQNLTRMIEEEISEKINSFVSLLSKSPDLPSDPAVYISGKTSCLKKLHRMVSHAASCLRRYAGQLQLCCRRRGEDSSSSDSSDESITAIISVESATIKVCEILSRWCPNLTETVGQAGKIQSPIPVKEAAAEIVKIIFDNLDSDSDSRCSPRLGFDMTLIINKLRDFFTSQFPSKACAREKLYKQQFYAFVKKQFAKLKTELKKALKKSKKCLVVLSNMSKPQDKRSASPESTDISFSGSVRGIPHSESSSSSRETPILKSKTKSSSTVTFNTIKSEMTKLYTRLAKHEEHGITLNSQENIKNSVEVRDLSRELTNKIFDLLMINDIYKIPAPVMGRSLTDSVISRTPRAASSSGRPFSDEVLYVLIEETVEKFLQKVLFWLENENREQTIQSDLAFGAAEEIQDFIATAWTLRERKDTNSDGSAASPSSPASASPKSKVKTHLWTAKRNVSTERSFVTSHHPIIPSRPSNTSPRDSSLRRACHLESRSRLASRAEPTMFHVSQQSRASSFDAEKMSRDLSAFILIQIATKSTNHWLLCRSDTDVIIKHLAGLLYPEIRREQSSGNLNDAMYQFSRSMTEDLINEFGSSEKVLKAAMAGDSSFDEAVLKHLKLNLRVILNPPPKKSKISRFFSAVKETLVKPFRCCFPCFKRRGPQMGSSFLVVPHHRRQVQDLRGFTGDHWGFSVSQMG